jgi:hypothetical protein
VKQIFLTLAAADLDHLRSLQRTSPAKTGLGLVFGAIVTVVVVVLIWIIFFRKREDPSARRYREHFTRSSELQSNSAENRATSGRRKKRRREHRQRNPTLAETGGLPPLRDSMPTDDPP